VNPFVSYLPSIFALVPLAALAAYLTISRPRVGPAAHAGRFLLVSLFTVAAQIFHFLEELIQEFSARFPESFGFAAMDHRLFVVFNVFWILVWIVSVWGVRSGKVFFLFPLWFLGIAGVLNLVAHLGLAIRSGGYFPGLMTAPVVALAGVFLLIELVLISGGESSSFED